MERASREGIKVGDTVIVRRSYYHHRLFLETVERTTRTQIILSGDRRFRKKDGMRLGPPNRHSTYWHRDYLFTATPKNVAEYHKQEADIIAKERKTTVVSALIAYIQLASLEELENAIVQLGIELD